MEADKPSTLYEQGSYYQENSRASRLSLVLEPVILFVESFKARWVAHRYPPRFYPNVLDIGAGNGTFLSFLKQRGYQVQGTTLSRHACDVARRRFGVELSFTPRADSVAGPASVDLATLWHVYEHLEEPVSMLKQIHTLLRDDGALIVEVPNPGSLGAHLCFNSWLGSDRKHHIHLVDETTLLNELDQAGFQARKISRFSWKFTPVYLWSAWVGRCDRSYNFNVLMNVLQSPMKAFRERPIMVTGLAFLSFFTAPLVLLSIFVGMCFKGGEILRIQAVKKG